MLTLADLQATLNTLETQRSHLISEGWYLQHCWLVQVKPGGNARTDRKYWQVRSRQPMFDGKRLKHLKPDEVDTYKAAIERGRQIKELDRQVNKLEQQLRQTPPALSLSSSDMTSVPSLRLSTNAVESLDSPQPQQVQAFNNVVEQDRLVRDLITKSQALRIELRETSDRNRLLRERILQIRNNFYESTEAQQWHQDRSE